MAKKKQKEIPLGLTLGGNSQAELKAYVERVERLEEEKAGIAGDIADIYKEAKDKGFDTKTMRGVIRLRRLEAFERKTQLALLDTYMHALGMLADTPLGQAAIARAT